VLLYAAIDMFLITSQPSASRDPDAEPYWTVVARG